MLRKQVQQLQNQLTTMSASHSTVTADAKKRNEKTRLNPAAKPYPAHDSESYFCYRYGEKKMMMVNHVVLLLIVVPDSPSYFRAGSPDGVPIHPLKELTNLGLTKILRLFRLTLKIFSSMISEVGHYFKNTKMFDEANNVYNWCIIVSS